jgi:hypothetical protein
MKHTEQIYTENNTSNTKTITTTHHHIDDNQFIKISANLHTNYASASVDIAQFLKYQRTRELNKYFQSLR